MKNAEVKRRADVAGWFALECRGPDGELKWQEDIRNLITNAGFDFIAAAMFASSQPDAMSHIAIGSGATAPAVADTAMQTELARGAANYAHSAGTKVSTLTREFAAGTGTGTVREVGVFNAASGGTMLAHAALGSPRTKGASDSLRITYTFTLSQQ